MKYYFIFLVSFGITAYSQEPLKIKVAKPNEKCGAALLARPGGNITKTELEKCDSIFIRGECEVKIISYVVTCCYEGAIVEVKAYDVKLTPEIKSNLRKLDIGNRLFVEEIKAMDLTGKVFYLPELIFKISLYP